MRKTKIRSGLALLLAFVLAATAVFSAAPVSAYAVTQSEIDELEAQRDAIRVAKKFVLFQIIAIKTF